MVIAHACFVVIVIYPSQKTSIVVGRLSWIRWPRPQRLRLVPISAITQILGVYSDRSESAVVTAFKSLSWRIGLIKSPSWRIGLIKSPSWRIGFIVTICISWRIDFIKSPSWRIGLTGGYLVVHKSDSRSQRVGAVLYSWSRITCS